MKDAGDYIERESLTNSLDELCDRVCQYSKKQRAVMCGACPLGHAFDLVDDLPAADVRPVVRGKWIPDYDYAEYDFDGSTPLPEPRKFQDGWQCSLCGRYMPDKTNFCPNCGADMRQKEEADGT